MAIETLEPGTRCLLKPVQRFDQEAHMVRIRDVDELCGLMAIYTLGQVAVQECVFDIELVNRPAPGSSKVEDGADGSWLDNW